MNSQRLQASRAARWTRLLLAVGALSTAGCSDLGSEVSDPDPFALDYDTVDPIVFSQHIQPVMNVSCNTAACHNSVDAAGGLDLTSYAAVARGAPFGGQVVPYRADRSPLYLHITGDVEPRMPLALDPLRDDVVRAFRRWIDAGAPNDAGLVMYSNVTDTVRTYPTLREIEHDAFHARIWGGLHFRTAMEDAYAIGHTAADKILRRRR